jgi:hypothetical protein
MSAAGNDNTSPAHDRARKNFDSGKTAAETLRDLRNFLAGRPVQLVHGERR